MPSEILSVVILAGGLATRLQPITALIPKALVDVAGEPFIGHQLRMLRGNGIRKVIVCVGHLGHMIEEVVPAYADVDFDVQIRYDGPRLLGTAGALRAAWRVLDNAFFVLYGDSYLTCDFRRVQSAFEDSGRPALMTVYRNAGLWDRSNVEFWDGRVVAYDKAMPSPAMQHIDYGLGIMRREALAVVPEGKRYDLALLYADLLNRGQLAAFEVGERFYEIGSIDGLEETRAYLGERLAQTGGLNDVQRRLSS